MFVPNTIRAKCVHSLSICNDYLYADNTTYIQISAPTDPIKPVISTLYASLVSDCDDLTIDPRGSYGDVGRGWKGVQWQVLAVRRPRE